MFQYPPLIQCGLGVGLSNFRACGYAGIPRKDTLADFRQNKPKFIKDFTTAFDKV